VALDGRQRLALQRFLPGLIEKVEGLGTGSFDSQPPNFHPRGTGIGFAELRVRYTLTDGMRVDINVQFKLKLTEPAHDPAASHVDLSRWTTCHYSLGYGPKQQESLFRFDLDKYGPHVHMEPRIKEHVPVADVTPNTNCLDPRVFVDMVAKYRLDGTYPVKRKKR
jgi:hypothetical protein